VTLIQAIQTAVQTLTVPIQKQFQSGTWGAMPQESWVTRAVAQRVVSDGAQTVWTAQSTHPLLPASVSKRTSLTSDFFFGHSLVDLAWATAANAASPSDLLEVKMRSSAASSQDHYIFLSDVVALAAEHRLAGGTRTCSVGLVAPVGERNRTSWLSCLVPAGGIMTVILDPASANLSKPSINAPYWCNPATGTCTPDHRSGYNKLFSGSTRTKLSGLFRRSGRLTITCEVNEATLANGYWVLLYTITAVDLTGAGVPFEQWWP